MTGEYQDSGEILVTLTMGNETGGDQEIDAIVGTGFGGCLMLTPEVVRNLALPQTDMSAAILADGSVAQLAVHEAVMVWNEEERIVPAYVGSGEMLLGMALLRGSLGTFEFYPGGLFLPRRPLYHRAR